MTTATSAKPVTVIGGVTLTVMVRVCPGERLTGPAVTPVTQPRLLV